MTYNYCGLTASVTRRAAAGKAPALADCFKARGAAAGTRHRRGRLDGVLGGVPGLPAPEPSSLELCPSASVDSWPDLTLSAGVSPRQGHHLSLAPQPPNGRVHLRAAAARVLP